MIESIKHSKNDTKSHSPPSLSKEEDDLNTYFMKKSIFDIKFQFFRDIHFFFLNGNLNDIHKLYFDFYSKFDQKKNFIIDKNTFFEMIGFEKY